MQSRERINEENYRQAVKFSENFTDEMKAEYLAEAEARRAFEQARKAEIWQNSTKKRPLVGVILLSILLISSILYWQTGRYQTVRQGGQMHTAFQETAAHENVRQKNERYIVSLQSRLREDPNNGDLWYELGQAYAIDNDFPSALICYDNTQKLLGEKAAVLGAMATADYYNNGQKLSERAKTWVEKALKLNPKESASLLLLASDSFLNNDYRQALAYWRKVLDSENESIDRRAVIQSMEMARQMLNKQ